MTVNLTSTASNKQQQTTASAASSTILPESVIIHPLVLLSVVDHYNRVAKNTKKRVVGVLLGQTGKTINVANSFALPFDEDEKDPNIWFLDHDYLESMWEMFKKINAKERVIGWYHSGPKLRSSDLAINEVLKKFTQGNPVLVVVDVDPLLVGLPTKSYIAIEEIHDDGSSSSKTFAHIPSEIQAEESEEVGVEHLLRDVKDTLLTTGGSSSSLSSRINTTVNSLSALREHLTEIKQYLGKVVSDELPQNNAILYNLQNIFNLLPHISDIADKKAFKDVNNDRMFVIYLSSIARAIIALHRLIDNKLENQEHEKAANNSNKENTNNKAVAAGGDDEKSGK